MSKKIIQSIEDAPDEDLPAIAAEALVQIVDRLAKGNVDFDDVFEALEKRSDTEGLDEIRACFEEWIDKDPAAA